MVLHEFLYVGSRHPKGTADGQTAITLDDECYCFPPGTNQMIDADGHVWEYINICVEFRGLLTIRNRVAYNNCRIAML
jgi:hypothetical protein